MVYFCYVDESGTPQIPGNTSHYVLCGISIPVKDWKRCDVAINKIKAKYGLADIADQVGSWKFARVFAECIDKVFFDPVKSKLSTDEQAFEQIVSRFEHYLDNVSYFEESTYGLLIHDNNDTVSKKHTEMMKRFHKQGTLWMSIKHIIETPLYVNSELTGLVQVADLCSVALRRFFENGETDLFDRIKSRFDSHRGAIVGVRHFSEPTCGCEVCESHAKPFRDGA